MTRDNEFKFVLGIGSRVWSRVSVVSRVGRVSRVNAGEVGGTGATSQSR